MKRDLLREALERLLRPARGAGPEEEAVDLGAARLAQAAAGRGHPAGSAAQPRTRARRSRRCTARCSRTSRTCTCSSAGLHGAARRPHRGRAFRDAHRLLPRALRKAALPVSIKEYLTCSKRCSGVASYSVDDFYYLSRAIAGEGREAIFDKFDRAFGRVLQGIEALPEGIDAADPRGMAAQGWSS
jgi:hypothetical protein